MGQYHMLVNLDRKEYVNPHELGLGLKQWEHACSGGGHYENGTLPQALYILTMTSPARGGGDFTKLDISGRWSGDRCVVLGDYTEEGDIRDYDGAELLWSTIDTADEWTDISWMVARDLGELFGFSIDSESSGWKDRTDRVVLPIT
jgi:hypothetical protein